MAALRPPGLKRFFFVVLALWLVVLAVRMTLMLSAMEQASGGLPFGVFVMPDGKISAQDFSYNLIFLHGIQDRVVPHPYRIHEQKTMVRQLIPSGHTGMTHAYSPVTLVLAQPLLALSGRYAYVLYLALNVGALLLLFRWVLLPPVESIWQIAALAVGLFSQCLLLIFALGQTALLTTALIGLFWLLLRDDRRQQMGWIGDLARGFFLWAICFRANLAIIPVVLMLGARDWRGLGWGCTFLLATWAGVQSFYGGWITGLTDYLYLLNHYNNADFTPFMRRDYVPGSDDTVRWWFAFDRAALLAITAALLIARWIGRIEASIQFQSMIWAFLLLSPYLLPSEDWILCLLVVESRFFATGSIPALLTKVLVLAGILNLRADVNFPWPVEYPLKLVLCAWMVAEVIAYSRRAEAEPEAIRS